MTTRMLQEKIDRYLADPCLPQLLAVTEGTSDQEDKAPAGEPVSQVNPDQAQMFPWCCAFNNLGVVEKRLRTQHGAITVKSIRIGNRLRNFMYGVYNRLSLVFVLVSSSSHRTGLFIHGRCIQSSTFKSR